VQALPPRRLPPDRRLPVPAADARRQHSAGRRYQRLHPVRDRRAVRPLHRGKRAGLGGPRGPAGARPRRRAQQAGWLPRGGPASRSRRRHRGQASRPDRSAGRFRGGHPGRGLPRARRGQDRADQRDLPAAGARRAAAQPDAVHRRARRLSGPDPCRLLQRELVLVLHRGLLPELRAGDHGEVPELPAGHDVPDPVARPAQHPVRDR
jgi:hypothetical protein